MSFLSLSIPPGAQRLALDFTEDRPREQGGVMTCVFLAHRGLDRALAGALFPAACCCANAMFDG